MSGYHDQPPPQQAGDSYNGGQTYTNPAFTSPHANPGMNYDTPHVNPSMNYDTPNVNPSMNYDTSYNDGPRSEYTPPVYGRTPLRHQQDYPQDLPQSHPQPPPQPQSRGMEGPPMQEGWEGAYEHPQHPQPSLPQPQQQQRGISPPRGGGYVAYSPQHSANVSPTRSRGVPADDGVSYGSYGYQQQHPPPAPPHHQHMPPPQHPPERAMLSRSPDSGHGYPQPPPMRQIQPHPSQDSLQPGRLAPGMVPYTEGRGPGGPGSIHGDRLRDIGSRSSTRTSSVNLGFYSDSPYQRYSSNWNPESGDLSLQDMRRNSQDSDDEELSRGKRTVPLVSTIGLGGVFGKKTEAGSTISGLGANSNLLDAPAQTRSGAPGGESDWLQDQKKASKKTRWIIAGVILVLLLLGGGGAAAGVILSRRNSNNGGGGGGSASASINPAEDRPNAPPVNGNTDSVKALMNNPKLHKSFYGMDYTPLNAVYPECLTWPPTQNNITKDIAVISQLTSRLRLYGNDCGQTEMVVEAIKTLKVDMKVWLGVYIDGNQTTNARQFSQMYDILDKYGQDPFIGVVIGNEALFSQYITESGLIQLLTQVRTNFTTLGYTSLNITTSDLGSAWTSTLAQAVDTVMANVHPFFAGVTVDDAPGWTNDFFVKNDVAVAKATTRLPNAIVSEVGWPSGGGTYLGSVAGIRQLNQFIEQYVCAANNNGTEYYWFVPFDEPWKERYNTPGKEWETQWGLMDVDRNLKSGVTIPDCPSR
ncbi:Glucan endo-1,3-beta-glucosidase [Drechslerella dactyloides]|uniref:glucan endo-1,3-beta-D-glucosidase n=1 Tax=Drechslerella dactyloides TaxID=74499 RepID=A0AAD6IXQ9_DREDA|nr:Glucan endo-1,3-beta-glucosidase [Drechslerella dactyloides]